MQSHPLRTATRSAGKDACAGPRLTSRGFRRAPPCTRCSTVSESITTRTDATTASTPTHLSTRSRIASRNFFSPGRSREVPRRARRGATCRAVAPHPTRAARERRRRAPKRRARFSACPPRGPESPVDDRRRARPCIDSLLAFQRLRLALGLEALRTRSTGDGRHRRGAGASERCRQTPPFSSSIGRPQFRSQHTDRVVVSVLPRLW